MFKKILEKYRKKKLYKIYNLDKSVFFGGNVYLSNRIGIGKYTYISNNVYINNCLIGKFCSIASNCAIGLDDHNYKVVSNHYFLYKAKYKFIKNDLKHSDNITNIGNDVWIGFGAFIKAGVKIGDGSIIGANAVVTKDIPPYAIVGGVPAKIIKYRFPKDIIAKLKRIAWWDWDEKTIKNRINDFYNINDFIKKYYEE